MKITIRLDDITPDMDWAKFDRFRALCDRFYVKPLIGVVPAPSDPKLHIDPPRADFLTILDELRAAGWEIAMHGFSHVYTTKEGGLFPLNHQSEFAGLSYAQQEKMIREGRKILADQEIVTDIFMAPSHSYDENTIRALLASGFTKMTDGFGSGPYEYLGMTFYPISFDQKRSLQKKDGVTTFVVHTNTLRDSDFERYEHIFRTQDMMPYKEYLYYPVQKRSRAGALKEYLMADGKRRLVRASALLHNR